MRRDIKPSPIATYHCSYALKTNNPTRRRRKATALDVESWFLFNSITFYELLTGKCVDLTNSNRLYVIYCFKPARYWPMFKRFPNFLHFYKTWNWKKAKNSLHKIRNEEGNKCVSCLQSKIDVIRWGVVSSPSHHSTVFALYSNSTRYCGQMQPI